METAVGWLEVDNKGKMRTRSVYIMTLGFGILVILIGVLGIGAVRRANTIYREMESTQDAFLRTEAVRRDIVADMYLADILVRDFLLDPSPSNAKAHRQQLLEIRGSLQQRMESLSGVLGQASSPDFQRLQDEVQGYWDSLDPIFDWTVQEKSEQSWSFLKKRVFPRRQAVVGLAREIARANRENLEREQQRIRDSQESFRSFLYRFTWISLLLGVLVAVVTTYRVAVLEREHERSRKHIAEAEDNLRRLSRRLVQAQEIERKSLSRELHDEVGQTLTAIGIELANIQSAGKGSFAVAEERLQEAKRLNADAIRSIRDLAMGLRPSMLDDIGLEAALQWQGREFSRHTGVPANVEVKGDLERLGDDQRTCIYRVVQEALTNCAKHAKASAVEVRVEGQENETTVLVSDDGLGIQASTMSVQRGLGLIGMKERLEALKGNLQIQSNSGKGTRLLARIPVDHSGDEQ